MFVGLLSTLLGLMELLVKPPIHTDRNQSTKQKTLISSNRIRCLSLVGCYRPQGTSLPVQPRSLGSQSSIVVLQLTPRSLFSTLLTLGDLQSITSFFTCVELA